MGQVPSRAIEERHTLRLENRDIQLVAELVPYNDEYFMSSESGSAIALQRPEKDQMLRIAAGNVSIVLDASGKIVLHNQ